MQDCVAGAYSHYAARIGKPPGPMLDDYEAVIREHEAYVLELGSRIVGVLVLRSSKDQLLLDNIAVDPAEQGRGHGRRLLVFAEHRGRELGFDHIDLYTHELMTENIALYERAGYVQRKRVTEKGYDRVYMRKRLGVDNQS